MSCKTSVRRPPSHFSIQDQNNGLPVVGAVVVVTSVVCVVVSLGVVVVVVEISVVVGEGVVVVTAVVLDVVSDTMEIEKYDE